MALMSYGAAGNQLTLEARTYYSMALVKRTLPRLVLFEDAQKLTIPQHTGGFGSGEIQFRRFNALSVDTSALTEGATPSEHNLTMSSVTTNLAQYGHWVKITDVMAMAGIDNVMQEAVRLLGEQAGQKIHKVMLEAITGTSYSTPAGGLTSTSTWAAGSNLTFAGSATTLDTLTASDVLTSQVIKKAVRELETRNVDPYPDGTYRCVIHPYQVYDLRNDSQWREVGTYTGGKAADGGPNILTGEIGQIHGVRFKVTTHLQTGLNASSVNVAKSFMYGPDAFGVFDFAGMASANGVNPETNLGIKITMQMPGKSSQYDPMGQWGYAAYLLAFACKVIDPDRMQAVYTSYSA